MPNYDELLFNPPAPAAEVTLRNPVTKDEVSGIKMLITTGADVTLIPSVCVNKLTLEIDTSQSYQLMGFDGNTTLVQSVFVDLIFLKKTFKGRFLLTDQDCGILGRDILNLLSLVFDGPHLFWEERKFFHN